MPDTFAVTRIESTATFGAGLGINGGAKSAFYASRLAAVVNDRQLSMQAYMVSVDDSDMPPDSPPDGPNLCDITLEFMAISCAAVMPSFTCGIITHSPNIYTVLASDSWIHLILYPTSGSGTMNVALSTNLTGVARVGTITVCDDQVLTITQAA